MRDEDDSLPRYAYDLVKLLDETVEVPKRPSSPAEMADFRDNLEAWAYQLGARALVDTLVAQIEEEERPHDSTPGAQPADNGVPDKPWGGLHAVFGSDGNIRPIVASAGVRVDEEGSE